MEFAKDESHLFFQAGHRLLISRILTGQFPNYEAVLPRDNNKSIVLERAELTDAVRRVSQLADQRSHAVKLSVSKEASKFPLPAPNTAKAKENIDKEYQGDAISIGFNSPTCSTFCRRRGRPISIELKDEQSAGQMRPLADESYRYRYIINAHAHLDSGRIERRPLSFSFESEFDTLKRPANFLPSNCFFKFRISRIGVHIHVQIRALAEHRRKQDLAKNIFFSAATA